MNRFHTPLFLAALGALVLSALHAAAADPVIFREYSFVGRWGETDPGATHPMQEGWARRLERLVTNVSLSQAVRAEVKVEYWGGHIGTSGQRFRINGNDWIDIPQPENTPTNPNYYYRTLLGNPAVAVPLDDLVHGTNAFVFTAGPQTKYDFGFGFYWIYAFTLRVYYEDSVAHSRARIAYPHAGATIGDNPIIAAHEEKADPRRPTSINRIDFIGYYEDYDWAGNGRFLDWHYQYRNAQVTRHLGTAHEEPFAIVWDNEWVPDQPGGMQIKAWVRDNNGFVYVTPVAEDIRLVRPDRSVALYPASDVPEDFGVNRARRATCTIPVGDPVDAVTGARLGLSMWSGQELDDVAINHRTIATRIGREIDYSHHLLPVDPAFVRQGNNTFSAFSFADYHKAEINWPGPALILAFAGGDPEAAGAIEAGLLEALASNHAGLLAHAAGELGRLGTAGAVDRLIELLEHRDWTVRAAAAEALGDIGDPAATAPLIDVLRREPPYQTNVWRVRQNAARSLAMMKGPVAQAALEAAAQDPDPLVRGYVQYALSIVQAWIEPLIVALGQPLRTYREWVSTPIGRMNAHDFPWVLHDALGWSYIVGEHGRIWMWNERLDWSWTEVGTYPLLWSSGYDSWVSLTDDRTSSGRAPTQVFMYVYASGDWQNWTP